MTLTARGSSSDWLEPIAPRTTLRRLERGDEAEMLQLARQSQALHHPWIRAPATAREFADLLDRQGRDDFVSLVACVRETGAIAGVLNLSQIFRGPFQNAYLGYYAHAAHAGRGHMAEGMQLLLHHAFDVLGLHRVEANIQPTNAASIALARGAGFRREGFSPRYLQVAGEWRDHERYAILSDEWREAVLRRLAEAQNSPS